jgi:predicted dehydrogenase
MKISPYFLGSGKASQALKESLKILQLSSTEFQIAEMIQIKRNAPFPNTTNDEFPVLFIANPHALHSDAILEGEKAGFKLIICEKPAAVSKAQIEKLKAIKIPVAICHVYRQMWGIQSLKNMVDSKEFGNLISIEGRYWQSSSAVKALAKVKSDSWKNKPELSGDHDVLLDLGTHWADTVTYLANSRIKNVQQWKSFINSEAPHRDTHLHLTIDFENHLKSFASISKTVHGAGNDFEIHLIGEKKSAAWKFSKPDFLEISEGNSTSIIQKSTSTIGSGHWPHHGLGWIEGYVEIIKQALKKGQYPTLQENLLLLENILEK